jgi:hypothetical protein
MTINEAIEFLEKLINETHNKYEKKVYNEFYYILSDLKNKELTSEQFSILEEELGKLELQTDTPNRKKHVKQKLEIFEKFLKVKFNIITQGYYTAIGMVLGITFGIAFGTAILKSGSGPGIGLSVGMVIGLVIGKIMDDKAKKENRVLRTKSN